ncbi:MAG: MarR family transcriptional regulator [Solirubrobacteraceae bacterium]
MTAEVRASEEHVGFALRLAYQRASANLSEAIGASGITPMQFQTLRRLHERGPMTQNELGRSVGMPRANIHRIVRRLVESRLVMLRTTPGDRRLTVVALTRQGERTLRDVLPAADAANALTLSVLSPPERNAVMDSLWKLASAAGDLAPPDVPCTGPA